MTKPHQSIRIFKSDFLEKFTHVHPILPLLIWVPVILMTIYHSYVIDLSAWVIGGWIAMGFLIWTFAEYVLHRVVFHYPATTRAGERFVYIMHGLHHDDPVDPSRLVMPPFPSVVLAILFFTIFRTCFGPAYVFPVFAGFLIGYLCYDYTHYAVHHFTPRTRVGRYLKQAHMIHHFVNPDKMWGVSSPLWDFVFGTYEETKRVQHGS